MNVVSCVQVFNGIVNVVIIKSDHKLRVGIIYLIW